MQIIFYIVLGVLTFLIGGGMVLNLYFHSRKSLGRRGSHTTKLHNAIFRSNSPEH